MPEPALEDLVAKQAIPEVLSRYCRGIDRRDWELLRSCYHPDAHDDHAIYRGERDGLIEFMREFVTAHCSATKHSVNNILITVTGDTAAAESQIPAWHRMLPERAPKTLRRRSFRSVHGTSITSNAGTASGGLPVACSSSIGSDRRRSRGRPSISDRRRSGAAQTGPTSPTPAL